MEILKQGDNLTVEKKINSSVLITMESDPIRNLSYADAEIELKAEATKNLNERPESPEECVRSETPSSNASTSGVCSMASSDFEYSEENPEEKIDVEKAKSPESPLVIIYERRNILDIFDNIYPFSVYQTTSVPKMNMSNYWERRSVYHRLGPYGTIDELDSRKCYYCDFYKTVPKNTICKRTS